MGQESRRVEWEQRVAAWKASGLTQKQYSRVRHFFAQVIVFE